MKILRQLLYLSAPLVLAIPVFAQSSNIIANIPGGTTCSTASGEPGFDVYSWKIGGTTADAITGGKLTDQPPQLQSLTLNRTLDACSEQIIKDFIAGTHIPTMTLIQYDTIPGGRPYAAVTVALTTSLISSYSLSGSRGLNATETIQILYSKVCISTVSQNASGSLQQPQHVCYDALSHLVS